MKKRYGSDLIVDMMISHDIPYLAMNPGSSFRGLHDSIVNYGGNRPELIECTHEEVAVGIAHGYAKASGRVMGSIVHNAVGLLHAGMAVYYSYIDRAPVMLFGATGPMDTSLRRPQIDWIHTAYAQGQAVRDVTKWDYQPFGHQDVIDSFSRGYRIATTDPCGPVYLCYDAGLQEEEINVDDYIPAGAEPPGALPSARITAPAGSIASLAERICRAQAPVFVTSYVGARPDGMQRLVALAEYVGVPVIDGGERLSFPTEHPLNASERIEEVMRGADLMVCFDVQHLSKVIGGISHSRGLPVGGGDRKFPLVEVGLAELGIGSWSQDAGEVVRADETLIGDSSLILEDLLERCRQLSDGDMVAEYQRRAAVHAARHKEVRASLRERALGGAAESPVATGYLVSEVGDAIAGTDWVLTANTVENWARRLWSFDKSDQHPGASLGTGTQIGISLGVALAHKGSGRLVVDFQPDGDLMFDLGALWTAAYHSIPMLIVMYNNRAYYNDWEHQRAVAEMRQRDPAMAYLGMEIDKPAPDFATLARGMGWFALGPIETGSEVRAAVKQARDYVLREGKPALVDVVTQHR